MAKLSRMPAAGLLLGLLCVSLPAHALSCLLFPLSCLKPSKKYGEETEGLVLDIRSVRTEHYEMDVGPGGQPGIHRGWSALNDSRDWYVWFKVGETLYQGWHQDTGMVKMMTAYKPNRAEWIGKTFKMRFMDEKFLGVKGAATMVKRPDGKEWQLNLVSIVGPDGVDECRAHGLIYCPPQAKVDRAQREAEQLAAVQKAGLRSATDVRPALVDIPEAPAESAAATAPDGGPAEGTEAAATPAAESQQAAGAAEAPPDAATTPAEPAAAETPAAAEPASAPQPAVNAASPPAVPPK